VKFHQLSLLIDGNYNGSLCAKLCLLIVPAKISKQKWHLPVSSISADTESHGGSSCFRSCVSQKLKVLFRALCFSIICPSSSVFLLRSGATNSVMPFQCQKLSSGMQARRAGLLHKSCCPGEFR